MTSDLLSGLLYIGDVARRTGLTVKAIRYYERIGLIVPAARNSGNLRQFSPLVVERLAFVKRAKSLGFTLGEISEIVSVHDQGQCTCGRVRQTVGNKLAEIEEKLREIKALRSTLLRVQKILPPQAEGVNERICPAIHEQAPGA